MTDFFIKLYKLAHFKNESGFFAKIRFYSLLRFSIRFISNLILPFWYIITSSKTYQVQKSSNFVITLTSFPLRIGRLWLTIETILRQTLPPARIILWLSKEQFPNKYNDLPPRLLKQCKRGLEIIFVDHDIRSHKKYKYFLEQFSETDFVTIDDDIYYSSNLLENLYKEHIKFPQDVIAAYVHEMKYDKYDKLQTYNSWNHFTLSEKNLFFGSGGGTYFPSGVFYVDVTNIEKAIKLCPLADDVWLNAQVRLAGNSVRRLPYKKRYVFLEVMRLNDIKLNSQNVYNDQLNDKQISDVINEYIAKGEKNPFMKE